jgi:hypothetical protein
MGKKQDRITTRQKNREMHKMESSTCDEVYVRQESKMGNVPAKTLSIFSFLETQI